MITADGPPALVNVTLTIPRGYTGRMVTSHEAS